MSEISFRTIQTSWGGGAGPKAAAGGATLIVVGLVLLAFVWSTFHIVPAGHRGVKFNTFTGLLPQSYGEGLVWKIPMIESVIIIDVRIDKEEQVASAASKDLQMVGTTVALNFHPEPDRVHDLYRLVGLGFKTRVIDPAIQESVKAVTARYSAEELITKREEVKQQIYDALVERLSPHNIKVESVNITDFQFSEGFTRAIEEKQTAEQLALKARRDLERIKVEAEQRVAQAQAEAQAQRLLAASVTPQIIELRRIDVMTKAVEKWNGAPPQVFGGALPFWDVRR
jgi:regulator of protease activity HflC (stomatin/prohibitin superfamily)